MAIYNIYGTSRDIPNVNGEQEIKAYYYNNGDGKGYHLKADMARAYNEGDRYFTSFHTECVWKESSKGEFFLQSLPNNTTEDNLLSLTVFPLK